MPNILGKSEYSSIQKFKTMHSELIHLITKKIKSEIEQNSEIKIENQARILEILDSIIFC